jgi:hypothetical protein
MFQLILRFKPWTASLDELLTLEDQLIQTVGECVEVDGHDIGASEANIFIECDDPEAMFNACVPVVERAGLLGLLSAGHRPLRGDTYTRVWPVGSTTEFTAS